MISVPSFNRLSLRESEEVADTLIGVMGQDAPLDQSLLTMTESCESPRARRALNALAQAIQRGSSVSEALESESSRFPDPIREVVTTSMSLNDPRTVLTALLRIQNRGRQITNEVYLRMVYPTFLGIMLLAIWIFISSGLVQECISMYRVYGLEVPVATEILFFTVSRFLDMSASLWPIIIPLLLVIGSIAINTAQGGHGLGLLMPPVLGWTRRWLAWAEFCLSLAVLVESAIALVRAIPMAAGTTGRPEIESSCQRIAERLTQGISLSEAIAEEPHWPPGLAYLITSGESQHILPQTLRLAGRLYQTRTQAIADLTSALLLVFVASLLVFSLPAMVITLFLPIFQLIQQLM